MGELPTIPRRVSSRRSPFRTVPFLDLGRIHAVLKDALLEDFSRLIDSGRFINGPAVAEFEAAFAAYCGSRYAVAVSSGLDACVSGFSQEECRPETR